MFLIRFINTKKTMNKSMMCLRGSVLFGLVFLFTAGLVGTFLSGEAFAQARPALVKDVDEPARSPFQFYVMASKASANCSTTLCSFVAPPVPAGKRLVITGMSGIIQLDGSANVGDFVIRAGTGNAPAFWVPPFRDRCYACPDCLPPARRCAFNESFRLYLDAGQYAIIAFDVFDGALADGWPNEILVTGYFIDL
jgi:hypothetical protein